MPNAALEREWIPESIRLRLPVDFPVTLEATSADRREVGSVANLSAKGMFAATRMLLPPETALRVTFYLPLRSGPRPLVVTARVRWVNDPAAPQAAELPAGMGLEFVGLDRGAQADLEGFLGDLMAITG